MVCWIFWISSLFFLIFTLKIGNVTFAAFDNFKTCTTNVKETTLLGIYAPAVRMLYHPSSCICAHFLEWNRLLWTFMLLFFSFSMHSQDRDLHLSDYLTYCLKMVSCSFLWAKCFSSLCCDFDVWSLLSDYVQHAHDVPCIQYSRSSTAFIILSTLSSSDNSD